MDQRTSQQNSQVHQLLSGESVEVNVREDMKYEHDMYAVNVQTVFVVQCIALSYKHASEVASEHCNIVQYW